MRPYKLAARFQATRDRPSSSVVAKHAISPDYRHILDFAPIATTPPPPVRMQYHRRCLRVPRWQGSRYVATPVEAWYRPSVARVGLGTAPGNVASMAMEKPPPSPPKCHPEQQPTHGINTARTMPRFRTLGHKQSTAMSQITEYHPRIPSSAGPHPPGPILVPRFKGIASV